MKKKDTELYNEAYTTEIDNLIILFTMNIKRTDDYALIRKIETLKKN